MCLHGLSDWTQWRQGLLVVVLAPKNPRSSIKQLLQTSQVLKKLLTECTSKQSLWFSSLFLFRIHLGPCFHPPIPDACHPHTVSMPVKPRDNTRKWDEIMGKEPKFCCYKKVWPLRIYYRYFIFWSTRQWPNWMLYIKGKWIVHWLSINSPFWGGSPSQDHHLLDCIFGHLWFRGQQPHSYRYPLSQIIAHKLHIQVLCIPWCKKKATENQVILSR